MDVAAAQGFDGYVGVVEDLGGAAEFVQFFRNGALLDERAFGNQIPFISIKLFS
jgi:hypothetical protein